MAGVLWGVLGGLAEPAAVPMQGAYGIMAEVESHPLPQTQCCSWTGGTTTHRQTWRCRKAIGMQDLQTLFC